MPYLVSHQHRAELRNGNAEAGRGSSASSANGSTDSLDAMPPRPGAFRVSYLGFRV